MDKDKLKVVIVGFKVEQENSVIYRKMDYALWDHENANFWDDLGQLLGQASQKADFISIRFIKRGSVRLEEDKK